MSKSALLFLMLTILTTVSVALTPPQVEWADTFGTFAVVCFAALFIGALVVGRKIKFDPILR